ncbi:MAG TPA: hypothetical protein VL326_11950 [Kofleriaceae bacterium]|nr:hypothetical protein [Kofleriaceae bacterium]
MKQILLLLPLVGCAQILGLEDTKFDQKDATVDAPSMCDGAPRCIAMTGRSACGQLFGTGSMAGTPLRAASPTGMTCAELGSSEGPCALSIQGQSKTTFFAGTGADVIAGEIDDCGRFVIPDLDASLADVAIVAKGGTDFIDSAALVLGRPTMMGTDLKIELPIVSTMTDTAWGMQLDSTNPPSVEGGYLVSYVDANGIPTSGIEIRVNTGGGSGPIGKPPATPWGAYFTGTMPFGMFDMALTTTQEGGTAAVHPATGAFMLGGQKTGRTCTQISLQALPAAVIHVVVRC